MFSRHRLLGGQPDGFKLLLSYQVQVQGPPLPTSPTAGIPDQTGSMLFGSCTGCWHFEAMFILPIMPAVHTGPSQLDQALAAEGGRSPKASQAGLSAASTPGAHLGHSKYEVAQVISNSASGVILDGEASCRNRQAGISPPLCSSLLWRMRCRRGPPLQQVLIPEGSVSMAMPFEIRMSAYMDLLWSLTSVSIPPSGIFICAGCHAKYPPGISTMQTLNPNCCIVPEAEQAGATTFMGP